MIGALLHYITHAEPKDFQPMKANMALLPDLDPWVRNKRARYAAYAERAQTEMAAYLTAADFTPLTRHSMADFILADVDEAGT